MRMRQNFYIPKCICLILLDKWCFLVTLRHLKNIWQVLCSSISSQRKTNLKICSQGECSQLNMPDMDLIRVVNCLTNVLCTSRRVHVMESQKKWHEILSDLITRLVKRRREKRNGQIWFFLQIPLFKSLFLLLLIRQVWGNTIHYFPFSLPSPNTP